MGVGVFAINWYYTHYMCDYEEAERFERELELRRKYSAKAQKVLTNKA